MNIDYRQLVIRFTPLFLLLLVFTFVSSCSSDDPVVPNDPISSPDEIMEEFQSALASTDILKLEALFDHETSHFIFHFMDEDIEALSLPTSYLNMGEMIQVWRNLFSGQEVLNNDGNLVPAITSWEVNEMDRNTAWNNPRFLESGLWDLYCNVQKVSYFSQFTIVRNGNNPPLQIKGNLEFKVRPPGGTHPWCTDCEGFALTGIEDRSWIDDGMGLTSFGSLIYQYFTNEAPEIFLVAEVTESSPLRVNVNTCQSLDSGMSLHQYTVRWCFEPGGEWTGWQDGCMDSFEYTSYGEKTIAVEVRDRWGLSSTTNQKIMLVPSDGIWR